MKTSEKNIMFLFIRIIAVVLLFVSYTDQPIIFYKILRIIICGVGLYSAYFAFKAKQNIWIGLMFGTVVLFNPIFPIYLERSQWEIYDAAAILILLFSIPYLNLGESESNFLLKYLEPIKSFVWSFILVVFAFMFWHHLAGNPIDEYLLIQNAKLANGILMDSYEVDTGDEKGNVYDVGVYKFSLPDGRKFKAFTKESNGEHEKQIEYLPSNPSINRIKGEGCQNIMEWLGKKIILGGLSLAIFLIPGYIMLRQGIKEIKIIKIK